MEKKNKMQDPLLDSPSNTPSCVCWSWSRRAVENVLKVPANPTVKRTVTFLTCAQDNINNAIDVISVYVHADVVNEAARTVVMSMILVTLMK